jgi:outer membrane receptor for ferrienterochelin and colicins
VIRALFVLIFALPSDEAAFFDELAHRDQLAYAYFLYYMREPDPDRARRAAAREAMAALESRLARVEVNSNPPGATIWVDRRELGELGTTPRMIVLAPGEHTVHLELADHAPMAQTITASVGQRSIMMATLAPYRGTLRVEGTPSHARAIIHRDEEELASIPLSTDLALPVGTYMVEIRAPGHAPAFGRAEVTRDGTEVITLAAAPLPRPSGRLLVSAPVRGAIVLVDGERRGTTPATLTQIAPGDHIVEVRFEGHEPFVRRVHVEPSRPLHVRARWER